MGDIADIALLNQSTLSKALDRLEDDGLVSRRHDPNRRRHVLVSATTKGKRLVKRLMPKAMAHERKVLAHLNKTDQRKIKDLLSDLIGRLGE